MSRPVVILCYPKIDHEKNYVYFWMPYSLLSIAHPVCRREVDVIIYDGNLSSISQWLELLLSKSSNTLCIGISIMTGGGQIGHALKLAEIAKNIMPAVPIVFGGPHVNVLPLQTLEHPLVDVVLTGPGQTSMPKYVDALLGAYEINRVPGLFMGNGKSQVVGPANPPKVELLGRYPWSLIDVASYIRNDPTVGSRTLNYVSSQGCVYKCRFCYELTYKRRYSAVPARELLEDVQYLTSSFNINGIKFYDADFFVNLKRVKSFVQELISKGPKISWAASINPNDILRAQKSIPQLLTLLKTSGCTRLLMGVESGSDRILRDVIKKGITREQILSVAKIIANNGILGSYTFIVGFPGETEKEQSETHRLAEELRLLRPQPETRVHLFAPYPGTPLFNTAIEFGFVPPKSLKEWSKYDYYDSQTPWTDKTTVKRAIEDTKMRLAPK